MKHDQQMLSKAAHVISICVLSMLCLLQVGGGVSGKSCVVRTLAQLTGHKLVEFPMNSDTDTTELLGGFQQVWCTMHMVSVLNLSKICSESCFLLFFAL